MTQCKVIYVRSCHICPYYGNPRDEGNGLKRICNEIGFDNQDGMAERKDIIVDFERGETSQWCPLAEIK